ncbi:hypothetical protein OR573_01990 [Halomonas sp. CH40]
MHKHIEWDATDGDSVTANLNPDTPYPGEILSARYKGCNVRVKVETYREDDAVSIASVVALITPSGERKESHHDLQLGDIVRLPDNKRSIERWDEENQQGDE